MITFASHEDSNHNIYGIFSNECDRYIEGNYLTNYWHGDNNDKYSFFYIDLKVHIQILSIDLRNARNSWHNDRSTKNISLYISNCTFGWTNVATYTLANAIDQTCENIPTMNYPVNQAARHVRFTAIDFYNMGSALQYLHVNADFPGGVVPDADFLCPGISNVICVKSLGNDFFFVVVSDIGNTAADDSYAFTPDAIFDDECDNFDAGNYWHGFNNNNPVGYFVIDLDVSIVILKISVKNSYNGYWSQR